MPYLAFNLNDGNEFVFDLLEDRLSLGRDPKNDIVIDNGFISGHHAEFLRQDDGTYDVVDLKSSNGTFVNGKRVERSRVRGGDRILFGRLESRYRERAPRGLAPADTHTTGITKAGPARYDGRRGDTESVSPKTLGTPDPTLQPPLSPGSSPMPAAIPKGAVPARIMAATASVPPAGSSTVPLVAPIYDTGARAEAKILADKIDAQRRELADLESKIIVRQNELLVADKDLTAAIEKAKAHAAAQAQVQPVTPPTVGGSTATSLAELQTQRSRLEQTIAALVTQEAASKAALEATTETTQSTKQELETLKAEVATATAALEQLQTHAASAEQRHRSAITAAEARVQALELREKELNQKLDDLSATDGRLSNASEALKAVEEQQANAAAQKASLVAAVLALENQQQEQQRELTLAREQGTAQRLLITTLSQRREELEKDVLSLDQRHQEATAQLQTLQAQLQDVSTAIQGKQTDLARTESHLGELRAQTTALCQQRAEHETVLQKVIAQTAPAQALLAEITTSTEALQRQQADLEAQIAEGSARHSGLLQRSSALEAALSVLITTHEERSSLLEQTKGALAATESKLAAAQDEHSQLEAQAAHLAQSNRSLEAKLASHADIDRQVQAAGAALTEARAKAEALRADITALTQEQTTLGPLRAQIADLRSELGQLKSQQQQAARALQTTLAERAQADTTLKTLQADAISLDKLLTDKRSTLDTDIQAKLKEASMAEARLQKAQAEVTALEERRTAAQTAIEQAKADEKRLKKEMPGLSTEMATLSAAVAALVAQRDTQSRTVNKLHTDHDAALRKLSEVETQITNLQEGVRVREERLTKTQSEVDREVQRLKAAQDQARTAEVSLIELQKEVDANQRLAATAKTEADTLQREVHKREQLVAELRSEEDRVTRELSARKLEISTLETDLLTKEQKVRATEHRLQELTTTGGKALSLTDTIRELESRQRDAMKKLRECGEHELALQAKINTLQETASRESQRAEQSRKDAVKAEAEHLRKAAELEARLREFAHHEQEASKRVEEIRQDLAHLDQRQVELREAETQVRRWQDVEKRLKDQLIELEEKHDVMRRELKSDQATVLMFAGDLIKRIDLIDILIQRYAGQSGGIDNQLRTLRASFEDILHQHGITEFDVAPNTEIDVALRQRIAVIESEAGNAKPRIVASYRPGFVYSPPEGKEVVLRKVEVKTTSR